MNLTKNVAQFWAQFPLIYFIDYTYVIFETVLKVPLQEL